MHLWVLGLLFDIIEPFAAFVEGGNGWIGRDGFG